MEVNKIIYASQVIEFVTVANEYVATIERVAETSAREALRKLQKILPLLYLKATLLPKTELVLDDELETYVTELDYNVLHQKWLQLLHEHDVFYEVFNPAIQFGDEKVTAGISEHLIDIYQDLRNFLVSYSIGNEGLMNDALYECNLHFEDFWGQQLVNVLRAIHMLVYSEIDFTEANNNTTIQPGKGNPKWLDKFWGTDEEDENV
ncbi:MAG: DUF5063 domain-containing protein [Draconibacterium sp.]|nr:MAG: DUF5063 domain-containing protein [Draconibacterium sp.]PIF05227.1 MAG: DUF5063 domain-containing protein [Draconibacterium sp.]